MPIRPEDFDALPNLPAGSLQQTEAVDSVTAEKERVGRGISASFTNIFKGASSRKFGTAAAIVVLGVICGVVWLHPGRSIERWLHRHIHQSISVHEPSSTHNLTHPDNHLQRAPATEPQRPDHPDEPSIAPLNLSPATVSVGPSESAQFLIDSRVYSGSDLNWSLQPAQGSISPSGLYTAPALITAPATVTIVVGRAAAGHETARATISLQASSPKIVPQNVSVGNLQKLQLTLRPAATSLVQWSISPTLGSISQGGLYTAPSVISQSAKVTVTAISSGSVTATSRINLQPVVINPITLASNANRIYVLRTSVSNSSNNDILWSINPQFGAISSDGVYTAPVVVPEPRTIQVTATSAADRTKFTHFEIGLPATISVKVAINPHSPVLSAGQREQLSATVTGSSNTTVTWTSSGIGNISPLGVFSAPLSVPPGESTVHIWATSNVDSRQVATTVITVRSAPAYDGPKSGIVTWTGNAGRNQTIKITNGAPGVSGAFPGLPIEATVSDHNVQILTAPSPANGWKMILVQTQAKEKTISIVWRLVAGR
jgi:hypothetical protein